MGSGIGAFTRVNIRLWSWWKHNLETSCLTWKHYYALGNIDFDLETSVSPWKQPDNLEIFQVISDVSKLKSMFPS